MFAASTKGFSGLPSSSSAHATFAEESNMIRLSQRLAMWDEGGSGVY